MMVELIREHVEAQRQRTDLTSDNYATEKDVTLAVRLFFADHPHFTLKEQVNGVSDLPPRFWKDAHARYRIDGVLIPSQQLCARGWPFGYVGLELKKSKIPVGKAIAQSLDYMNSSWELKTKDLYGQFANEAWDLPDDQATQLSYVAIVPWRGPYGGPLLSISMQQRVIGGRLEGGNFHLYPLGGGGIGGGCVTITPTDVKWTDGETGRKNGSR